MSLFASFAADVVTGKTHSMMGPGFDGRALGDAASSSSSSSSGGLTGEPGLIPKVMASLFSQIAALETDTIQFLMRACYIEIYQVSVHTQMQLPETARADRERSG